VKSLTYARAGVDATREEVALKSLLAWVGKTFAFGSRQVALDIGYFANVIDLGHGLGLAVSTDGVGTKLLVAQMLQKYDTIGIDCVAMNVNDVLCVGAKPLCMLDYIAVEIPDPQLFEEVGKGLYEGAKLANIPIVGGEIAQVKEMVKGLKRGHGFDLVGTCIGEVQMEKVLVGQDILVGDVVIGLKSSGIHSNGLTLARKVLFKRAKLRPDDHVAELGRSLGEELLEPTRIYVREVLALLEARLAIKALIHITGDGLLNLARVKSDAGFMIDHWPEPPPIFSLIQKLGNVSDAEMFRVFNMGIGFCLVLPEADVEKALAVLRTHRVEAFRLGHAVSDKEKKIILSPKGLVGQGDRFVKRGKGKGAR